LFEACVLVFQLEDCALELLEAYTQLVVLLLQVLVLALELG
jgi:hypothetical protein